MKNSKIFEISLENDNVGRIRQAQTRENYLKTDYKHIVVLY